MLKNERYIRIKELVGSRVEPGLVPVTKSTIWKWVQEGKFPAPIHLGPRVTAWRLEDILNFLENCGKK